MFQTRDNFLDPRQFTRDPRQITRDTRHAPIKLSPFGTAILTGDDTINKETNIVK